MPHIPILRAGLAIQSLGLATSNLKALKPSKPSKKLKDFTGLAATNIVGVSLLRSQANLIGSL